MNYSECEKDFILDAMRLHDIVPGMFLKHFLPILLDIACFSEDELEEIVQSLKDCIYEELRDQLKYMTVAANSKEISPELADVLSSQQVELVEKIQQINNMDKSENNSDEISVFKTEDTLFCLLPDEVAPRLLRSRIEEIRRGDCFIVGSELYTADADAYCIHQESGSLWMVYDTYGNSWFKHDILDVASIYSSAYEHLDNADDSEESTEKVEFNYSELHEDGTPLREMLFSVNTSWLMEYLHVADVSALDEAIANSNGWDVSDLFEAAKKHSLFSGFELGCVTDFRLARRLLDGMDLNKE